MAAGAYTGLLGPVRRSGMLTPPLGSRMIDPVVVRRPQDQLVVVHVVRRSLSGLLADELMMIYFCQNHGEPRSSPRGETVSIGAIGETHDPHPADQDLPPEKNLLLPDHGELFLGKFRVRG